MITRRLNHRARAWLALLLLSACSSAPQSSEIESSVGNQTGSDGSVGGGVNGPGPGNSGNPGMSDGGQPGGGGTGQGQSGSGGTVVEPESSTITLPMVVDRYYIVSGYAGDGEQGRVKEDSCPNRAGDKRGNCHAFTWKESDNGWAAIFWQYPANNWGNIDKPGRAIPKGAKQIRFYAWGKNGGEAVSFGAGLNGQDSFTITAPAVTLTTEPKQYAISLEGIDYGSDVISGFMFSANQGRKGNELTFYVDDIVWETSAVEDPTPEWPTGPGASGVSVRVRNLCAFPLWIGGSGKQATLTPERARLDPQQIRNYDLPKIWEAARVNAFKNENDPEPLEKAELTFYQLPSGEYHVSYNVTYVDWVGLPLEITSLGGACNRASHTTGCLAKESDILNGCPETALRAGDRCLSPRTYCLAGNQNQPLCRTLDASIQSCASCPKGSTSNVFACDGPYAQEPRMCAALNRGMVSDPENPNETLYYKNPPYNTYAKWVHQICPGIYAFSYDDWLSHGGYRDCVGGNEVRITFCPGG